MILAGLGWGFGVVVEDVLSGNYLAGLDRPTARFFVAHRSPWATIAMRAVTRLGSGWVLVPLGVAVAGAWVTRRRWRPAAVLAVVYLGAFALSSVVKHLVGRGRPPVVDALTAASGFSFPSGHATQAAAVFAALAFLVAGSVRRWSAQVAVWAVAATGVILVGISRLYLGVHWLSDVVGGVALGGLWVAVVAVTVTTLERVRRSGRA